jgi:hypothetical protein
MWGVPSGAFDCPLFASSAAASLQARCGWVWSADPLSPLPLPEFPLLLPRPLWRMASPLPLLLFPEVLFAPEVPLPE